MNNEKQLRSFENFFKAIEDIESKDFMETVEQYLSNDSIELICDHIEDFYGVQDDEEIGMLSQLVVMGYLLGRNDLEPISFKKPQ